MKPTTILDHEKIQELKALDEPGQPSLLIELTALFQTSTPAQLEILKKAIDEKNTALLKKTAHPLKSSARNLGAHPLGELYENLEKCSSLTEVSAQQEAKQVVLLIEKEFQAVLKALQQVIQA